MKISLIGIDSCTTTSHSISLQNMTSINTHSVFRLFAPLCCLVMLVVQTLGVAQNINKKQASTPQKKYADSALQQLINNPSPEQQSVSKQAASFLKSEQADLFREWYGILSRGLGKNPDNEIIKQYKSLQKINVDKVYLNPEWSIHLAGKLITNHYTPAIVTMLLEDKNINIIEELIGNSYPTGQVFFAEQIIIAKIDTIYQDTTIHDGMNTSCLLTIEKKLKGKIASRKLLLRSLPSSMMMFISDSDIAEPIPLQKNQSYMFFLHLEKPKSLPDLELGYFQHSALPTIRTIQINGKPIQKIYDICEDLSDFFIQLANSR